MLDPAIKRASDLRLDLFVHPDLEIQIPKKSQQREVGEFLQWVVRPVPGDRRTQLVRALRQWIRGRFQHLRHLVISDDPGQGKTVLSLQIENLLCTPESRSRIFGDSYPRLVVHWMSRLPQASMPDPSIVGVLMADTSLVNCFQDESVRKKVIDYAKAEGRLVIVLDAFDELPADQKRQVAKLFEESSDKIRWIVTGRDWAINREIADQKLFDPKEFFRLRIKAFSTELQDLYMSRALPGVEWRSVLSGSKEDWDELLGLPATLRELLRALSLTSGKKGKGPRFESPSDLFCFSSQQMLLRELRKDKNAKAIAEDGLDLKRTVAARLVQRGIGAVALEMALRGHWREVIKPTTPELDAEIEDIWKWAKKRFIEGGEDVSEESWKWVRKFLNQYEFNGGASQADLGSESLVFRNIRIQELNLGRYLVNFASPKDLRSAIKSSREKVPKRAKRAQSVIECIGLESWTNSWLSAIKMPVLERGKNHGVKRKYYERGLRLLFERPTQVDQRRPTELMWYCDRWIKSQQKRVNSLRGLDDRIRDHLRSQFLRILEGKEGESKQRIAENLIDENNFTLLADPECKQDELDTGVFVRQIRDHEGGSMDHGAERLTQYQLCKYAISNEQFQLFDANFNQRDEKDRKRFGSANKPAVFVSWFDCFWFSEFVVMKEASWQVVLPTEAQWEYGARAGSRGEYFRGPGGVEVTENDLKEYAHYHQDSGTGETLTVRGHGKKPNAWGLEMMAGNVWELCSDWYEESRSRLFRGGSWVFDPKTGLTKLNWRLGRTLRNELIGFRLALSPSEIPKLPEAGDGEDSRATADR